MLGATLTRGEQQKFLSVSQLKVVLCSHATGSNAATRRAIHHSQSRALALSVDLRLVSDRQTAA